MRLAGGLSSWECVAEEGGGQDDDDYEKIHEFYE